MTKIFIVWIFVCFVVSIGAVVFLVAASEDLRQQPGSFLRVFPPHPALEGDVYALGYNSYYIAGSTPDHVYLGNYTAPLHVLVINTVTRDTSHVRLKVKGIEEQKFWAVRVKVVPPYYYVYDGAVPVIYKGNIYDWHAERLHDRAYFQDMEPLSSNTFLVRALSKADRENVLGKLIPKEPYAEMKEGILEKQVDGIFCTDGMLHYSKERQELIYIYRYRNEFLVLDTNLVVNQRHHTIDTTSRVRIQVGTIESKGSTTLASPPRTVNRYSAVSGDYLFVQSMLLAKNEPIQAHEGAHVVDVYRLDDGGYLLSFYVYHYRGLEKLRMFQVNGDTLFVLYDEHFQVWKLDPRHFSVKVSI